VGFIFLMVPFEYGAVCLSDCFMYLCKKIRFVSQRIFVSAQFLYNCCSLVGYTGEQLAG
jgi:hypothetical protein